MKHLIRYKLKAGRVAENESLVRAVYEALETAKPSGVHYATFRLDDGVSFVHIVSYDSAGASEALTSLPAFRAFSAEVKDRCAELPVKTELAEIGSYGFFDT
jgi:quinol monooxygenase YgiN